jgi:hypothetical protein
VNVAELENAIRGDPITREYCRRVQSGRVAPLSDAIDLIGEQRVRTRACRRPYARAVVPR